MKNARGFTLMEVIIALFITTGSILIISSAWSGNFLRIRKTNMYNNVATLLERKMQEVQAEYKEKKINEIPESDGGDFENDFPNYRWELKSRDLVLPDLSPILAGQEGGADETLISMIKQMTEYLNKVVKEVKVTIFVKGVKGEVQFSATQYFVDYEKDFGGLPGAGAAAGAGGTQ